MVDSMPFDYYQMEKCLKEIDGYLAELRYIDQVFAYMDDVATSWWETVIDGVLSAGSSAGDSITVDFDGTVAFSRSWRVPQTLPVRLPWQDSLEEEVRKQIKEYKASAPGWASSNMDSIRSMTDPLAYPTGSVYLDDLIQPVQDALACLEDHVSNDFGKLRHSLGNWRGDAAEDFAVNFYHPFEDTLASHRRMLAALATGLQGAHAIVDLTQQSLMNVLKATRDALLEQLGRRAQQAAAEQAQQQEQAVKTALIIVSATIPLFKKQDLWDTKVDLVGLGSTTVVGAATSGAMEKHTLTGDTAEELLVALSKAIGIIDRNSNQQYEDIDERVKATLSRMESIRDTPDGQDGRLVPPQPRLLDGTDSRNFHLPEAR